MLKQWRNRLIMTVNKFYFLMDFILHNTPMFFRIDFCVMCGIDMMMMMSLVRVCSVINNNITARVGGVAIVIDFMSCGSNRIRFFCSVTDNLILVMCLIFVYVSHCIY